jgi:hypothetical protein
MTHDTVMRKLPRNSIKKHNLFSAETREGDLSRREEMGAIFASHSPE